ncbi:MAG: hypothetical protein IPG24_09935 [Leptospiraceae bacterium]|nr:hypothetical protein [Leptospiraceae bacterium]
MKTQIVFLLSFLFIVSLADCSNTTNSASCRQSCKEKTNLCLLGTSDNSLPNTSNLLICEMYSHDCKSGCGGGTSSSKSSSSSRSSSSRSSGSSSRSSGSSSSSSGGGSSSSGGSSGGGSGGSSHEILGNF